MEQGMIRSYRDEHGNQPHIYYYNLDGNISAGKTILLTKLQELYKNEEHRAFRMVFIPEIFEKFNKYKTFEPLYQINSDPKMNTAIGQLHIIRTVNQHIREVVHGIRQSGDDEKPVVIVSDRSIFSPRVFLQVHRNEGHLSEFACQYLLDECDRLAKESLKICNLKVLGMFILETDVDESMKRIRQRGRSFEQMLERERLQNLFDEYLNYHNWWQIGFGAASLTYNNNADPAELMKAIENAMKSERIQ